MTPEDNGKVLAVVDGEWDKAKQDYVMYATFEYSNLEGNEGWACDKTAAEVIAWINAGKIVFAKVGISENTYAVLLFTGFMYQDDNLFGVSFSGTAPASVQDVKEVQSIYIGYSALGISFDRQTGYLS